MNMSISDGDNKIWLYCSLSLNIRNANSRFLLCVQNKYNTKKVPCNRLKANKRKKSNIKNYLFVGYHYNNSQ
jgi:hypothetical protein